MNKKNTLNNTNLWLLLLLGFALPLQAAYWNPGSHDELHTAQAVENRTGMGGGTTFVPDPHVWVYTSSFAKRYGMPDRWVDDSLKGVEAIAYKVVDETHRTCGYGGNAESCVPSQACLFDFYIPKSASLPWKDDRLQGFKAKKAFRSTHFLRTQNQKELLSYDTNFRHDYNSYASRVGFDHLYMSGDFDEEKQFGVENGPSPVREFDREFLQDLDYISVQNCGFESLLNYASVDLVFTEPIVVDGKPGQYYDENIVPSRHRASIPKPFLKRAIKHHEQYYGNHLWNVVKRNLQQDQ
jgi:hypothetical protein